MHSDLQGLLPAKAVIDNVEPEARSQPSSDIVNQPVKFRFGSTVAILPLITTVARVLINSEKNIELERVMNFELE